MSDILINIVIIIASMIPAVGFLLFLYFALPKSSIRARENKNLRQQADTPGTNQCNLTNSIISE